MSLPALPAELRAAIDAAVFQAQDELLQRMGPIFGATGVVQTQLATRNASGVVLLEYDDTLAPAALTKKYHLLSVVSADVRVGNGLFDLFALAIPGVAAQRWFLEGELFAFSDAGSVGGYNFLCSISGPPSTVELAVSGPAAAAGVRKDVYMPDASVFTPAFSTFDTSGGIYPGTPLMGTRFSGLLTMGNPVFADSQLLVQSAGIGEHHTFMRGSWLRATRIS